MNNAINEIKNTLEATNSRITEAEDRISELEDRMVEINESERIKEKQIYCKCLFTHPPPLHAQTEAQARSFEEPFPSAHHCVPKVNTMNAGSTVGAQNTILKMHFGRKEGKSKTGRKTYFQVGNEPNSTGKRTHSFRRCCSLKEKYCDCSDAADAGELSCLTLHWRGCYFDP